MRLSTSSKKYEYLHTWWKHIFHAHRSLMNIIINSLTMIQVADKSETATVMVERNRVAAALKGVHAVALRVRGNIVIVVMNIFALIITMYRWSLLWLLSDQIFVVVLTCMFRVYASCSGESRDCWHVRENHFQQFFECSTGKKRPRETSGVDLQGTRTPLTNHLLAHPLNNQSITHSFTPTYSLASTLNWTPTNEQKGWLSRS